MTTLSNEEIWRVLLRRLTPSARTGVTKLFPPADFPPFFSFVLDALEKDAAIGRITPISGPLMDIVIQALSDPAILEIAEAIRLALAAVKLDHRLDDKLLNGLVDLSEAHVAEAARVLEIIDAISDCQRLALPLMKFLKLPQSQLRSKAVRLIARARHNPGWAEAILDDPDPRVRSNLIDGLAPHSGDQVESVFRRGAEDRHHRVAVGALLQLYWRGDQASYERISTLAREGDEPHRLAAAWALGQIEAAKPAPAESQPDETQPDETPPDEPASQLAPPPA